MPRKLAILLTLAAVGPADATVGPDQVFVIVNANVPESAELAGHYRAKRDIPAANVLALDLPKTDEITRADFDERLRGPLREALRPRRDEIKVLLFMYGVPLRVGAPEPAAAERAEIREIVAEIDRLRRSGPDEAGKKELETLVRRRNRLSHSESRASVDSELMLLWRDDYDLHRWQMNPLYFQVPQRARESLPPTLMTCRLDGPSPGVVRRMIDDAAAAEKEGLKGKVYIDARGIRLDPKKDSGTGYGGYDESMRETAALFEEAGLDVTLDDEGPVFPPGSCPDCAIYCGWYSHGKFVDSCGLTRGSVAWHLASSEAVSLRRPGATFWCKNLLEKGACATLGPVAEPYTIGFPKPAEFFGFLATGEYTLAECYARSVRLSSWMGTLIGDPLYNPYAASPLLPESRVRPSPARGR